MNLALTAVEQTMSSELSIMSAQEQGSAQTDLYEWSVFDEQQEYYGDGREIVERESGEIVHRDGEEIVEIW